MMSLMRTSAVALASVALTFSAHEATAQTPDSAKRIGPPIQAIATASAVSTEKLGSVMDVRQLPDGRVMVNDGLRRRLILMDTMLVKVGMLLDSAGSRDASYGTQPGTLIPFKGDTTLYIDPASYTVLYFDPNAKLVRVRSVWSPRNVSWYSGTLWPYGWVGMDSRGRIVHRLEATPAPPPKNLAKGTTYVPSPPDSSFIVAIDVDTREQDTLGVVHIPKSEYRARRTAEGYYTFDVVVNPLPLTDQWAALSDGTIVFLRGIDYRIDYINPDRSRTSSAKLPYEWQRMTDEAKKQLVDSTTQALTRSAQLSQVTNLIRWVNLYRREYPKGYKAPERFILPPGLPKDWKLPEGVTFPEKYTYACPPGVEPTMSAPAPAEGAAAPSAGANPSGVPPGTPSCIPAPLSFSFGSSAPPPPTMRPVIVLDPTELPDYRPPFATASARSDMDGNLWVRTIQPRPIPGGIVYDVINRQGELFARYQIPPGYTIVGFGKGKIVYLSMRDAKGIHLARVRLK
jgi:hypothetical protein